MTSPGPNQSDSPASRPSRRVPAWIIVLTVLLAYLGVIYVDDHGAAFSKTVYAPWKSENDFAKLLPPKDPMFELGRQTYPATCSTCHQNSGLGTPGQFPPLVGSEWVLAEGPNRLIRILLNGAMGEIEVKGAKFNNVMVPWRDVLNDKQIAGILTYIRTNPEWGHKASPVKPEEVAKIRKATAERASSWNAPELLAVPVKD